jgi:hypothetical protein
MVQPLCHSKSPSRLEEGPLWALDKLNPGGELNAFAIADSTLEGRVTIGTSEQKSYRVAASNSVR